VPDKIFEVAEGGLSDGHPFIFFYGNPTRNTGKFYRVCFGNEQEGWVHKAIDSRDCTLPNKELLAEWIETYGVDSDFVRVRVRGLPPTADELQFIDRERIKEAQMRTAKPVRRSADLWRRRQWWWRGLERSGIPPRR
jgi:hypothetical protein